MVEILFEDLDIDGRAGDPFLDVYPDEHCIRRFDLDAPKGLDR